MNKACNFPNDLTYREALQRASSFLLAHGQDEEAAYHLLLGLKSWQPSDWFSRQFNQADLGFLTNYQHGLRRMVTDDYPWQYLVGEVFFYQHVFKVSEDCLIPRPETEALVAYLIDHLNPIPKRILDLATGSGVIGLSLKTAWPDSDLVASDISQPALDVAIANADFLDLPAKFYQGDLFQALPSDEEKFDLIVTNPPYISNDERPLMSKSTLKFEPPEALFAKSQGLAIYIDIAQVLDKYLAADGLFVAEIGYQQGPVLVDLFTQAYPQAKIWLRQDFAGLDRNLFVKF
ncbi:hypothetical protein AWM75_01565 [Aerococcus urinaehominis]|uniref:peptide chain release factor N(5)-glutamine methyltransferase n=1 Tax=Aerococcus urinaehominis TaxID=128944 RepID=A0A0X8FK28_9LACT|nr:peptide chain release factor N(5)-glutamine methyltransferase [Aerococcus urinaehominis]AMB98761.1 hypothetical protein AWM75_01565 [Aerococcus urinaehominis]SDM13720.1 release factor glutamine methyltransferase [Aerococcus urinaehominis]